MTDLDGLLSSDRSAYSMENTDSALRPPSARYATLDFDGGSGGIGTLALNQLAGAWLFYEQMSAFRKSHGLFE